MSNEHASKGSKVPISQKEAHAKATQRQLETDKQKNDRKKKDTESKKRYAIQLHLIM